MAPSNAMAVGQKEQQHQATNPRASQPTGQSVKPRKRKGGKNQPGGNNQANSQAQQIASVDSSKVLKQQVINSKCAKSSENDLVTGEKQLSSGVQTQPASQAAAEKLLVPAERVSSKKKHDGIQVPQSNTVKESKVPEQPKQIKQLSTDEADDIDAGIELDGSSNSGSSVKDVTEDPAKSASASPVMAQTNAIDNNSIGVTTKHAVELAPVEQRAAAICSDIGPSIKKASTTTTRQQLAANQQVIDADEQQLQQQIRTKQRKSSLKGALNTSIASNASINGNPNTSASLVASPPSPALCKICEQHVYQMERILAEKFVYHKACFRCYRCKIQLRVDNYSSHEGQVYCKAHHRQIFQPQVKLDSEDDADIVAKSTCKVVDGYLLQRGRLSELSYSFLKPKPEEIRKRQMIICENEPAELPKDVIRCDTKVDDGIDRLNLNLNNILEKFERGSDARADNSQPSSAGVIIDKPSFDIKKTLLAFETNTIKADDDEPESNPDSRETITKPEKRTVKKLTNIDVLFNRQNSAENESSTKNDGLPSKSLVIRRSESLMMRLKKYESRINGEHVAEENSDDDDKNNREEMSRNGDGDVASSKMNRGGSKKLTTLKNQWENGDISLRRSIDAEANDEANKNKLKGDSCLRSSLIEKDEELSRIRQQLARRKSGESNSIKNIYENAIREAQKQERASKSNSSDLSALNGLSTTEIQQQLLQNGNKSGQDQSTPTSPDKDHFHLNLSNKANKLKERFEQGLVNNGFVDSFNASDDDAEPVMTKMEQLRQEKLEDLSVFTEGEIKAREARTMFQQIDKRLSAAGNSSPRSSASISASMSSRVLQNTTVGDAYPGVATQASGISNSSNNNNTTGQNDQHHQQKQQQPIRLTNNVRT